MKENNLLTIKSLHNIEIGTLMFKYHQKLLPKAFDNIFTLKTLQMNTRCNSQIVPKSCRSTVNKQSLSYIGPKIRNDIPLTIRNPKTIKGFKQKLNQFLINFPL